MSFPIPLSTDHIIKLTALFFLMVGLYFISLTTKSFDKQFALLDYQAIEIDIANAKFRKIEIDRCISTLELGDQSGCDVSFFVGSPKINEMRRQIKIVQARNLEQIESLKSQQGDRPRPEIHGFSYSQQFHFFGILSLIFLFLFYIFFALWWRKVQKPLDELAETNLRIRKIELEIAKKNLSLLKKTRIK